MFSTKPYLKDCSTEASENQNPSCCYSECESGTQLGDRTMVFVKEMKASTGNGHEGVPAILTTGSIFVRVYEIWKFYNSKKF